MVSKWEIHFCSLDPTQGSEQRGTRPVLIVSNDAVNHALPVVTVLPLSSLKPGDKVYPSEVLLPAGLTGLSKDSAVNTSSKSPPTGCCWTVNSWISSEKKTCSSRCRWM